EHGDDDDGTLDGADQIFADEVRQQHDIADDFQDEGTADRSPYAPDAAPKRGAADDDRGDRLQFPQDARGRRGRAEARHVEEDGDGDAKPLHDIGDGTDTIDRDAGIARHVLVRSDRDQVTAIAGAVEHEGGDCCRDEDDDDRKRNPEYLAEIDRPVKLLQ